MSALTGEFTKEVIAASWQGGLVILLILLLRPVLGVWVPARWRYALWVLALLRLLVPAFLLPASPASVQNLAVVDRPFEQAALALERKQTAHALPVSSPSQAQSQGPGAEEGLAGFAPAARKSSHGISPWTLSLFVWLAGVISVGTFIVLATVRLHRRVLSGEVPMDDAIERVWSRCCARLSIQHPPRLIATGCVESPALIGLLHPALLIPKATHLAAEDWEHILLHELAHFRQRDHWTQAVQLLALCVHWFNPLVWLGFRYLRADRELAADEWALRHLEDRRSEAYGQTLLKVLAAEAGSLLPRCTVGILEDGAQMKQRLRHIVAFTPRRVAGTIVGAIAMLALAAIVLGRQAADLADYEGFTPAESLAVAAQRGDRAAMEQLLHDGVDINAVVNVRGERTALTTALANRDLDFIRLLVAKGADVQLKPGKASAPLIVALKKGWTDIADYLRSKGATCDAEILAAANNDAAAVEKYLAGNKPSYDQVKLLAEVAAAHGHRALFAKLWDALNALPDKRDYFPFSRDTFVTAVANGHRGVIEEIISRDPNLEHGGGVNRLGAAAQHDPALRDWLKGKGIEVPEYSDGERLIDAAEREDLPEIRRLLKTGADVNYRGESDWTPISKAATWGCPKAVKLLLENHAEPNTRKHTYTALSLAKTPEIADLLFAAGADVNAKIFDRDVHGISYCVSQGSKEMVQWFFDHGVDPTKVKCDEPTLLFSAGSPEVIDLLVKHGVDVNAKDAEGRTALIHCLQVRPNSAKIVAALLKHGADPNARMKGGYTPLMQAEDGASVDALVAAGADLDATDDRGKGVFYTGWGSGIPSRVEALRRHGMKLDPEKAGELLVNAISLQRDLAAVKALLAMGANPNSPAVWEGRKTRTPLAAAIGNGEFKIAEVLRAAGAKDVGALSEAAARGDLPRMAQLLDERATDINEVSAGQGETPLHFAVGQGQAAAVKLLLARGANVNLFTATGYTALDLAGSLLGSVEYQNFSPIDRLKPDEAKPLLNEIIAAIRERKPDPNFRNAAGETALMASAAIGGMAGLHPGIDINAQRADGMTALMIAITTQPKNAPKEGPGSVGITDLKTGGTQWMSARAHFVKTLLERETDLTLRNKDGKTALDLARENGNEEILALMEATAAKR